MSPSSTPEYLAILCNLSGDVLRVLKAPAQVNIEIGQVFAYLFDPGSQKEAALFFDALLQPAAELSPQADLRLKDQPKPWCFTGTPVQGSAMLLVGAPDPLTALRSLAGALSKAALPGEISPSTMNLSGDEQTRLNHELLVARHELQKFSFELQVALSQLAQSEAHTQALLKALPDMVYRLNVRGYPIEPRKDPLSLLEGMSDELKTAWQKAVDMAIQTDVPQTLTFSLQKGEIHRHYHARFMGKGPDEVIAVVRDITDQNQMFDQLAQNQKLAELGTLAAGIAHEMNSPLQVIVGLSTSLLDRFDTLHSDPERLRKQLDMIRRNGWRCVEITRVMRNYARTAGDQFESISLNDIILDTLLLIEHQLKSWSSIHVLTRLAEDLPLILCNRNQIAQVIVNLLTNARDAMPLGGQITISTYVNDAQAVILDVHDQGTGIPPDVLPRIFDPFFTTKPAGVGTGLGLPIVAEIIHAHGGEVNVESQLRQGTRFTLSFPPAVKISENPPA